MADAAAREGLKLPADAAPAPRAAPVVAGPEAMGADGVLALQRSAGNQKVTRAVSEQAFAVAASGPASEVPRRGEMEAAFGTSFAGVGAHLGGAAAQTGLGALGARAATRGSEVVFRETAPAADLVAHELAHVVQQRRSAAGVARSPDGGAGPGSAAERAAERAAEAVRAGEPVPDVGAADPAAIHLAPVKTAGGEWDTDKYAAVGSGGAVGDAIGADIDLKFTPKDPVLADTIGLTQTVKTLKSTAPAGPVGTPSMVGPRNTALSLGAAASDPGRAVDQGDGSGTLPNTNPLYAVENSPGTVSATLGDVPASAGFGAHAARRQKADGTFEEVEGHLKDGPRRALDFAGQEWRHVFEATALAVDGPLANLYLGSVEWGWKCDATGTVTLDPDPIKVVREGSPTAAFMDAARVWNAARFTDTGTGTVHDTVDLPIEAVDAGALSTVDLCARLVTTRTDAASAAGPAKVRKEFEALALERELMRRNVKIAVKVNSTEDITGADDVYVKLSGKSVHKTAVQKINDRGSHDFLVPISAIAPTVPIVDPIDVQVFDEDLIDADDLLVTIKWLAPYAVTKNTATFDDADYEVTVAYER
jgi:hypothetical protein